MNVEKLLLLSTIVLLGLSSCSKQLTPFSQRMYERYNWSNEELSKIQFYLSEDVVLRRTLGNNETRIREGRVRVINGREVEEVIIKSGTPGVFVFSPKQQRLGISFDTSEDSYLMFGPNPKRNERYVLLAKSWDRDEGIVTYKGKEYITSMNSSFATLMIDLDKATRTRYKTEVASGRRVE